MWVEGRKYSLRKINAAQRTETLAKWQGNFLTVTEIMEIAAGKGVHAEKIRRFTTAGGST